MRSRLFVALAGAILAAGVVSAVSAPHAEATEPALDPRVVFAFAAGPQEDCEVLYNDQMA